MTVDRHRLLAELIDRGVARHEARWLLEEFDDVSELEVAVRRRLAGEPLQYVLGHWPFRGLDLRVTPDVLIPRPETEELVSYALAEVRTDAPVRVLDLGCGSGAIGLALLQELRELGRSASLVSIDVSPSALEVATTNARRYGLDDVSFRCGSWFTPLAPEERFDVVVANPPYVGSDEYRALDPVLLYEPHGALVSPDYDGVSGFGDPAHIIDHAFDVLECGGTLLLEHGHSQGDVAVATATARGYANVRGVRDLAGHPRFLIANRSTE